MSELPTCSLSDCNERPEVEVRSTQWGAPYTRKLCSKHAEWAKASSDFEVVER